MMGFFVGLKTYALFEAFALVESAEMETGAPTPFVELRGTVIITVYDVFIVCISVLHVSLQTSVSPASKKRNEA